MKSAWLSMEELVRMTAGKKVVFWGCYDFFEKTMAKFKFPVEFIVDMNVHLHGEKSHHGYDVKPPSVLGELTMRDEYFVIVSSTAFYEIFAQLNGYGFDAGTHYSATPLLSNMKILNEMFSLRGEVLFSSSDAPVESESRGGGLYHFDLATQKMTKKISGTTRGIVRDGEKYFVADAAKGIRVLNQDFEDVGCIPLPQGSYPHGLALDEKRKLLYLVQSRFDQISVYDIESYQEVDRIFLTNKCSRSNFETYQHHINDICVDGDSLFISMFSRTGMMQADWYQGAIVDYDVVDKQILGDVASGLWMPHSVKMLGGRLAFLNSMRGDLHIAAHRVESHFNGFIRGLDFDGRYYYIGQSTHRYFDLMEGSSNNISIDSGVYVYDAATHATRFFQTPMIKDINTLLVL
ncbi:MAG: DUF4915 domain-containing protein [Zetaproteobacteria bacterium]|nr:DUF4915 domain-containing protein [Zetaproteobacteria bacterium]